MPGARVFRNYPRLDSELHLISSLANLCLVICLEKFKRASRIACRAVNVFATLELLELGWGPAEELDTEGSVCTGDEPGVNEEDISQPGGASTTAGCIAPNLSWAKVGGSTPAGSGKLKERFLPRKTKHRSRVGRTPGSKGWLIASQSLLLLLLLVCLIVVTAVTAAAAAAALSLSLYLSIYLSI